MAVATLLTEKELSLEFISRVSTHSLDDADYLVVAYNEISNTYIVYNFNSGSMTMNGTTKHLSPSQALNEVIESVLE